MSAIGDFADVGGHALGLSERDVDQILACLRELDLTSEARQMEELATGLSRALEGFMGIPRELMFYALLDRSRGMKRRIPDHQLACGE